MRGKLAVAAVATALATTGTGAAIASAGAGTYRGTTSQTKPIVVVVARGGRFVQRLRGQFTYACTNGTAQATANGPVTINRNLKVKGSSFMYHGPVVAGQAKAQIGAGTALIDGTFAGRNLAGTIDVRITLNNGFQCNTGPLTFTAKR